jgi:hypothetical protein
MSMAHDFDVDTKVRVVGPVRQCRVCGCTDEDCSGCIERTGEPCGWAAADLCTACA